MALRRESDISASFSMASMTDIVFLLLIFFLLTSTMINTNAIRVLLPKSTNQVTEKMRTTVTIKQTGPESYQYYVNTDPTVFENIEPLLQQALINDPDPVISLFMDKSIPVEEFVKIMNIGKRNKYKVLLATAPE